MFVLSEFHVIRTIRNTKCIAGVIFYFHVNQNFVLSEFVLSAFHCIYIDIVLDVPDTSSESKNII